MPAFLMSGDVICAHMGTYHVIYPILKDLSTQISRIVQKCLKDHNITIHTPAVLVHISISYDKNVAYSISYDMRIYSVYKLCEEEIIGNVKYCY